MSQFQKLVTQTTLPNKEGAEVAANEENKKQEYFKMGQIYLENDEQFEAIDTNGAAIQISLRGGCNHPVSKLICLGNGKYDAILSSGVKIQNLDLDKVGKKVGKIDIEGTKATEIGEPELNVEKKSWFQGLKSPDIVSDGEES